MIELLTDIVLTVAGFLLILLGTLLGVVFKEWKACRPRTHATLALALMLLIAGKLLLDYGNYLGTQVAK